jgi:uncharacterized BrkB/YihY/UPF0761 family membrane protein
LQQDILDSALGRFPVLGADLAKPGTLSGNGWALAFGLGAAIWAGLGVIYAAQDAMDAMWNVPRTERPNFVAKRLRALAMLSVVGAGTVAGSAVAGVATQLNNLPWIARVATTLGTAAINSAALLVGFRLLTAADLKWRTVLPGAVVGGAVLVVLQVVGGWYLTRVVSGAGDTYGTFAAVIGLLTWLALQARVVLYAAEINVVLALRLWPRPLWSPASSAPSASSDKQL